MERYLKNYVIGSIGVTFTNSLVQNVLILGGGGGGGGKYINVY